MSLPFKLKWTLVRRTRKGKQIESDNSDDEDMEIIEALLAKRATKRKEKYKWRVPLIFFSCDKVGHIATKCPNKSDRDEKKFSKYKSKKDYKSYKDKSKKSCYIANESDNEEDEMVYIAVKDYSDN